MLAGCTSPQAERTPADYVNPLIGAADNGHTFPGATRPFGMVQPSPVTGAVGWRYCSEYMDADSVIWGFSQTHLSGTGCMDLGDILVMPMTGTQIRDWNEYRSLMDKATETATPGYYAVELTDAGVRAELTATPRVALHRYTYDAADTAGLLIDLQHGPVWNEGQYHTQVLECSTTWRDDSTLTGTVRNAVWVTQPYSFAIRMSRPAQTVTYLPMNEGERGERMAVTFGPMGQGEQVELRIALSTVDEEAALANIEAEAEGKTFDEIRAEAHDDWNRQLSAIEAEGTDDELTNLYTAAYHLMIQPNRLSDADGRYRNAADSVVRTAAGDFYSTFSLWDTYRAAHPLYILLQPERVADMVTSLTEQADAEGVIPLWALWGRDARTMIGNHGVGVIAEAYAKGIEGFDVERAYDAVRRTMRQPHGPKSDWTVYDRYGYFPTDLIATESVSSTLETTYDDYAAADMARRLGRDDDAAFFEARSLNYRNLMDTTTMFMRPRLSDGSWKSPFNPSDVAHSESVGGDYTEGNAWQYTWHVQHDIPGLIEMFGGERAFLQKLDSVFTLQLQTSQSDVTGLIGQYAHGNEPSHHVTYLYGMAGRPERTQELIREIFDTQYRPEPDGLCGNDDCGQMSAWYIFSAMGFYPVNPVSGEYQLGAPQLPRITLHLPGGKDFTSVAEGLSEENKYVKEVRLNGEKLERNYITHDEVSRGGELRFVMTDRIDGK